MFKSSLVKFGVNCKHCGAYYQRLLTTMETSKIKTESCVLCKSKDVLIHNQTDFVSSPVWESYLDYCEELTEESEENELNQATIWNCISDKKILENIIELQYRVIAGDKLESELLINELVKLKEENCIDINIILDYNEEYSVMVLSCEFIFENSENIATLTFSGLEDYYRKLNLKVIDKLDL